MAESFFSSLKKRTHQEDDYTKARVDIFDYIEVFYSRDLIVISVASVWRPLKRPRREDRKCLLRGSQSIK